MSSRIVQLDLLPNWTGRIVVPRQTTSRHEKYWFEDGNVVVKTGHKLYKLHRSLLVLASQTWCDMLSVTSPEGSKEGTEAHPILLNSKLATVDEMEMFCRAVYGGIAEDVSTFTLTEVGTLLEISRRWLMDGVNARAVSALNSHDLTAVQRIDFGRRFDLDQSEWMIPAFHQLARTLRTLDEEDMETLGPTIAMRIMQAQDAVRRHRLERIAVVYNAGCCGKCQTGLQTGGHRLAVLVTSALPSRYEPENLVGWLQVSIRALFPDMRDCKRVNCHSWPNEAHIRRIWLRLDNDEKDQIARIAAKV
ncbi:hypothetical protein BKA62DRAFT_646608 [Auriculariales sp. MPI-PUGE-AT-0066]|nr:hypothetical protein BKA62DRAFT_646608 [Auriculariales sp. MPI-PUGE-AT-0066]